MMIFTMLEIMMHAIRWHGDFICWQECDYSVKYQKALVLCYCVQCVFLFLFTSLTFFFFPRRVCALGYRAHFEMRPTSMAEQKETVCRNVA